MLAEYCKWFYKAQKNLEMRREITRANIDFQLVAMLLLNYF